MATKMATKMTNLQESLHHEESTQCQKDFQKDVLALHRSLTNMGNPFCVESNELVQLHTGNIMQDAVIKSVKEIEAIGTLQYARYEANILNERSRSLHELLKQNSLPLFTSKPRKTSTKMAVKLLILKENVALFSRFYIKGDMNSFFCHENVSHPPSLSVQGQIRLAKKSDRLGILSNLGSAEEIPPQVHVTIIDGAALVHLLPTKPGITILEYGETIFIAHIKRCLETSTRVNIVWDKYTHGSLKECTRASRGIVARRKVEDNNKLAGNCPDFLCNSKNKHELFTCLSAAVSRMVWPENNTNVITTNESVFTSIDTINMQTCTHEEADKRIVVHILNAQSQDSLSAAFELWTLMWSSSFWGSLRTSLNCILMPQFG